MSIFVNKIILFILDLVVVISVSNVFVLFFRINSFHSKSSSLFSNVQELLDLVVVDL